MSETKVTLKVWQEVDKVRLFRCGSSWARPGYCSHMHQVGLVEELLAPICTHCLQSVPSVPETAGEIKTFNRSNKHLTKFEENKHPE